MILGELNEKQVRTQYNLLKHEGYYTRVRWDDKTKKEKGGEKYVKGVEELIKWALPLCGRYNLYMSRNPFNSDGKVAAVSALSFDIDPIRDKDAAATEEELRRAIQAAQILTVKVAEWTSSICVSGNGTLVIFPFDTLFKGDIEQFTKKAQQFEREIINNVKLDGIRIDHTNYSKAVVKLMGSISTKGDQRDWRYAKFLSHPVFSTKQSRIRDRIESVELPSQAINVSQITEGNNFPSKSEADYTLAVYGKRAGLGPNAIRELLRVNPFGRQTDERDQERVLKKVFSKPSNGELSETSKFSVKTPCDAFEEYRKHRESRGQHELLGISTGFKWLDNHTRGYRSGNVYCIQAITNAGKSVFIVQAAYAARQQNKRVLFITTEMGRNEVYSRYIAIGSGLSTSVIDGTRYDDETRKKLSGFERAFKQDRQFFVSESSSPKIEVVENVIKEVQPDIVLIDYFQHVDTGDTTRTVELSRLARGYERISKQYDLPILVAAQLHEIYDWKTHKRVPSIKSHVKDCKAINDAASAIIVLDWGELENDDGMCGVPVRMSLEKNRHGPRNVSTVVKLERHIPRFME